MNNILQINYWTIGGFAGQKKIETAIADARKMGFEGLELTFGAGYGRKGFEVVQEIIDVFCK